MLPIGSVSNFVTQFSLLRSTKNMFGWSLLCNNSTGASMRMLMAQLCQPSESYSPLHLYYFVQHMELGTVSR